jgi:tripeptidyl-peptidase-1
MSATIPFVFSVSYGEDEKSVGMDYASRVNVEFQKVGVRGTSIMFASGDSGAGGNCSSSGRFTPNFPSGSPFITAVGGVTGGTAGQTPTGEVVDFISGGGFSDYWPTPSWQTSAVATYLSTATGLPASNLYNQSGRGYPDVAAQSENFVVVQGGIPLPGVGGTSCASPSFSGIVSLLNDLRLAQGKSSLGFLNPLIYQTAPTVPNSFNDVVSGYNAGCVITGFPAAPGWDPTTGWGSPNYRILSGLVLSLP